MNKIRILYIEDTVPPPNKLHGNFEKYFEITYKDFNGNNFAVKSINNYRRLLQQYEQDKAPGNKVFPVEIVAADYNLSKWSPQSPSTEGESIPEVGDESTFSGFLLQVLHTLHFQQHPTGIVSATAIGQQVINDFPDFERIHDFLRDQYHASIDMEANDKVDFQDICKRGANSLRKNICGLYARGIISLSQPDLISLREAIDENNDISEKTLEIRSRYDVMLLPVRGLFIDCDNAEIMIQEIKSWLALLYGSGQLNECFEGIRVAREVINWSYEDENETIFADRKTLSELVDEQRDGESLNREKIDNLKRLKYKFGVICDTHGKPKRLTRNIKSVYDLSVQFKVLRFAVLYGIAWTFVETMRKELKDGRKYQEPINEEKICNVICPSPSKPVILPRNLTSEVNIFRLRDANIDSSGISISHMLQGKGRLYRPEPHANSDLGFMLGERKLFSEMILDILSEYIKQNKSRNRIANYKLYIQESPLLQTMLGEQILVNMLNIFDCYLRR